MRPLVFNCYYPFRSNEVANICDHLTASESISITNVFGATNWRDEVKSTIIFLLAFIPPSYLSMHYSQSRYSLLVWPVAFPLIVVALLKSQLGSSRWREFRAALCHTAYAKQMGYTPETLRMFSFSPRISAQSKAV